RAAAPRGWRPSGQRCSTCRARWPTPMPPVRPKVAGRTPGGSATVAYQKRQVSDLISTRAREGVEVRGQTLTVERLLPVRLRGRALADLEPVASAALAAGLRCLVIPV